jgi:HTH-type transcriptional regulator/antitoxin HipB
MRYTPEELGRYIRQTRKSLGVTQERLALTAGTGLRFISDLENGKPTCELGKVLTVMHRLGIEISLTSPITRFSDLKAEHHRQE